MKKLGRSVTALLLVSGSLLAVSCATEDRPGRSSTDATSSTQRAETDQTSSALANSASGSEKDTLQACTNRIPSDATPGQRMLAEQGCLRDEATRKKYPHRESLP